jgi:hypothetical protein
LFAYGLHEKALQQRVNRSIVIGGRKFLLTMRT